MKKSLLLISAFAFSGCAMFLDRAPNYAGNAMDSTANRGTDVALDSAENKARSSGESAPHEEAMHSTDKVTRKVDDDDVLVKQGSDFVVGKAMGAQILIVKTGSKVDAAGAEVIQIRPAKKGDLKVGTDVYFTTARGDVRRAGWTMGAVTDNAALGDGKVAVGPEAELLWDGQVAVKR